MFPELTIPQPPVPKSCTPDGKVLRADPEAGYSTETVRHHRLL